MILMMTIHHYTILPSFHSNISLSSACIKGVKIYLSVGSTRCSTHYFLKITQLYHNMTFFHLLSSSHESFTSSFPISSLEVCIKPDDDGDHDDFSKSSATNNTTVAAHSFKLIL